MNKFLVLMVVFAAFSITPVFAAEKVGGNNLGKETIGGMYSKEDSEKVGGQVAKEGGQLDSGNQGGLDSGNQGEL